MEVVQRRLGRRVLVFNPREYGSIGDQSWNLLPTRFPIFQVRAKDLIDLCRDRLGEDAIDSSVEAELVAEHWNAATVVTVERTMPRAQILHER